MRSFDQQLSDICVRMAWFVLGWVTAVQYCFHIPVVLNIYPFLHFRVWQNWYKVITHLLRGAISTQKAVSIIYAYALMACGSFIYHFGVEAITIVVRLPWQVKSNNIEPEPLPWSFLPAPLLVKSYNHTILYYYLLSSIDKHNQVLSGVIGSPHNHVYGRQSIDISTVFIAGSCVTHCDMLSCQTFSSALCKIWHRAYVALKNFLVYKS